MLIILIAFLSGALLGALTTALIFGLPPAEVTPVRPSHGSHNTHLMVLADQNGESPVGVEPPVLSEANGCADGCPLGMAAAPILVNMPLPVVNRHVGDWRYPQAGTPPGWRKAQPLVWRRCMWQPHIRSRTIRQ